MGEGLQKALFLLVLVLLVQGAAAQSHLHFLQQSLPTAAASDHAGPSGQPEKGDPSTGCALCQEAAMAGAYILPLATFLPPPPPAIFWITATPIAKFGLIAPPLGWQSRAPPR